jgi:ACS family hexuronate transporter-like MFS transporter
MFPKSTIATLTGIAQCAAGCGSFIVNKSAGKLFTYAADKGDAFAFCGYTGKPAGYMIVFCYCAVAYLIGWACMKSLVPKYKKVEL